MALEKSYKYWRLKGLWFTNSFRIPHCSQQQNWPLRQWKHYFRINYILCNVILYIKFYDQKLNYFSIFLLILFLSSETKTLNSVLAWDGILPFDKILNLWKDLNWKYYLSKIYHVVQRSDFFCKIASTFNL